MVYFSNHLAWFFAKNGIDAIINLAGTTVSKRWTSSYKQLMYDSRIGALKISYRLLSENKHNVQYLCSASGISIYPSSLAEKYSEDSEKVATTFFTQCIRFYAKIITRRNEYNYFGKSICFK